MNHPDIELLTQFALDDPLALDAATLVHITDCAECRREIEQVQRVVDAALAVGGRPTLRTTVAPPDRVWDIITLTLDTPDVNERASEFTVTPAIEVVVPPQPRDEVSAAGEDWLFSGHGNVSASERAVPVVGDRAARRTVGLQIFAAAVVGGILGASFTWVLADNDDAVDAPPTDLASSSLVALGDHVAGGEITLSESGRELTVDLDASNTGKSFLQVWLLDDDTDGMVALGVLDGPQGTFAVPRGLDLSVYDQVDVSIEPYDGDPAHSADSLARGPLP